MRQVTTGNVDRILREKNRDLRSRILKTKSPEDLLIDVAQLIIEFGEIELEPGEAARLASMWYRAYS